MGRLVHPAKYAAIKTPLHTDQKYIKIQARWERSASPQNLGGIYPQGNPGETRRPPRFLDYREDGILISDKKFGHARLQDFERGSRKRHPDVIVASKL